MDYSLLVGIERDDFQRKVETMRTRSTVGDGEAHDNLQFVKSRYQDRVNLLSSSLNSNNEKEQDPMKKFDRTSRKAHGILCETETVHLSIIDYLQEWNTNKKLERMYKTQILQKSGSGLSAIEPISYAQRFKWFVERYVLNV
jgi:hypothetical protein